MNDPAAQIIETIEKDELKAVADLKSQVKINDIAGIIFFCSSNYDLGSLSRLLSSSFPVDIITGCTTAGEIAAHYQTDSIVALILDANEFAVHASLIQDINRFDMEAADHCIKKLEQQLVFSSQLNPNSMFAFFLADGLSKQEESLISRLHQVLGKIEVLGGSAGDDLALEKTHVFYQGKYYSDAAIISLIEVKRDFQLFKTQHFIPTDKEIITTKVDTSQRLVNEINGEPAALAYANINGLDLDKLSATEFSMYPLMLNLGDQWYVRSIAKMNSDLSLNFYCAIDEGLPLSVGKGLHIVESLQATVDEIKEQFETIDFTLGCDCILRRLEVLEKDKVTQVEPLFNSLRFIGFNSYGEQYNGVHFNQTLTGIVVGKKADKKKTIGNNSRV